MNKTLLRALACASLLALPLLLLVKQNSAEARLDRLASVNPPILPVPLLPVSVATPAKIRPTENRLHGRIQCCPMNQPELTTTLPTIPPDPPPDALALPGIEGIPRAWLPQGSYPTDWKGGWYGVVHVRSLALGTQNVIDPEIQDAKRFLLQKNAEGSIFFAIAEHGKTGISKMYPHPIGFCREKLKNPEAGDFPTMWVSDCHSCCGSLHSMVTGIEKAKREGNSVRYNSYWHQAVNAEKYGNYENRLAIARQQLADAENRLERTLSDQSAPIGRRIFAERLVEYQRSRIASIITERKGMQMIAKEQKIRPSLDWFKYPGATYAVHLNGVERFDGQMIESQSCVPLLNTIKYLDPNTYESDVVIKQSAENVITGERTGFYAETVIRLEHVAKDQLKATIAKVIYNDRGQWEDKVLLDGTLWRDP